jgi:methionyl-tRNA synthetase
MTHRCARCGEHKPLTEFYRQTSRTDASSDNRGGYCKPCQRAYRAQNRERTRAVKRAWRYRTNYGLTLDDFEAQDRERRRKRARAPPLRRGVRLPCSLA